MKKIVIIGLVLVLSLGAFLSYWGYQSIYAPAPLWDDTNLQEKIIYVPTGATYKDWKQIITDSLPSVDEFWVETLADRMNVKSNIHPGRYVIERETSLYELLNIFRNGFQKPVKVVIPVKWTLAELAKHISIEIEADSADLLHQLQYNSNSGLAVFPFLIPNTYEFYWNTNGTGFAKRMNKEWNSFWERDGRRTKAEQIGLSPQEVYTLASIVYRETNAIEEMPTIAGVYLNRLSKGIALQADPTVKFAVGDLGLRRILTKHLSFDSPYNTYKYPGLPPGPISMADIRSIDAVLNAHQHDYLYFCARPDSSGKHAFSENYHTHLAHARKFHQWLNSRNIR